jgi:hypothetical protein
MSYLKFEDRGATTSGKTRIWSVSNSVSGVLLGWVSWYPSFRKYSFRPEPGTVYDACCLKELGEFVDARTKEHKA